MKHFNQFKLAAVAVLCAGLTGGLQAQQSQDQNKPARDQIQTQTQDRNQNQPGTLDRDQAADTDVTAADHTAMTGTPKKINKASGLIGMEVQNPQKEKLGDVKDVVIDFNTGKISYVVLSHGGVLGIGEKLVAVPLNAFRPGPEGDNLILNADKQKLEQAKGFDRDHWPSVSNPAWGAEWQTTQPGSTIDQLKRDTERNADQLKRDTQDAGDQLKNDLDRSRDQLKDDNK